MVIEQGADYGEDCNALGLALHAKVEHLVKEFIAPVKIDPLDYVPSHHQGRQGNVAANGLHAGHEGLVGTDKAFESGNSLIGNAEFDELAQFAGMIVVKPMAAGDLNTGVTGDEVDQGSNRARTGNQIVIQEKNQLVIGFAGDQGAGGGGTNDRGDSDDTGVDVFESLGRQAECAAIHHQDIGGAAIGATNRLQAGQELVRSIAGRNADHQTLAHGFPFSLQLFIPIIPRVLDVGGGFARPASPPGIAFEAARS